MSLGCSNKAGGALGTALCLLLLASVIQGLRDVEVFHYAKVRAVVGQNVTLPCTVQKNTPLRIVSIEWSRNKKENTKLAQNTKLALYSQGFGLNLFGWPNITMQIENKSHPMGSHLHLYGVAKWDSGIYICDIASFPLGTIRSETELEIKDDVKIMCDVESAIEVHAGDNVTIQCREFPFPDAKYKWTKKGTLVSENVSLELRCVTDAHAGVYTLTVNTGNVTLHEDFIITVLTATTSFRTDLVTASPQPPVTEAGSTESAGRNLNTSPASRLSTIGTNAMRTMSMGTDDSRYVTAEEHMTTLPNTIHTGVTTPPVTHTDPHRNNSTGQEINPTHNLITSTLSDQSVDSYLSTTSSSGNKVFRSTQETTKESTEGNPGSTSPLTTGNATIVFEDEGTDGRQSHLLVLKLISVPIVVLIVVAGFLYTRHILKERMDRPPSFKPPPPPVKYTSARSYEVSTQHFPNSREL